jgi:hypothetical protein
MKRSLCLLSCMTLIVSGAFAQNNIFSFLPAQPPVQKLSTSMNTVLIQDQSGETQVTVFKSKRKAFMLSMIVPGLGDLYLNNWDMKKWGNGKYFFTSEILLWSSFFYLKSYSGWMREDSRAFASQHAGVNWKNAKPSKYTTMIGKFSDIYSYNETQRRLTGNTILYPETPDNYWKWDSRNNQKKYDDLRIKSHSTRIYATYVVYGVVVNHLLSSINTVRTFRIMNKQQTVRMNLLYVNSLSDHDRYHGIALQVSGY